MDFYTQELIEKPLTTTTTKVVRILINIIILCDNIDFTQKNVYLRGMFFFNFVKITLFFFSSLIAVKAYFFATWLE